LLFNSVGREIKLSDRGVLSLGLLGWLGLRVQAILREPLEA
jgi:hypothetical protein